MCGHVERQTLIELAWLKLVKMKNNVFFIPMTPEESNLITGLFDRLRQASSQPKDAEADQLIRSKIAETPLAPYLLVQSVLVLQQAVSNAQSRIAALEKQVAEANAAPAQQGG